MKRRAIIFFALFLVYGVGLVLAQDKETPVAPPSKLDIVLVLDNSGSMKKNDPEFLTKKVVAGFLDGLTPDTRIGLVIFAEKAALILPLTELKGADTKQKTMAGLEQVDYKGQLTNSPAAIERAFYELKQNGRQDAEKLLIFLTDGIVETGDKQQDRDQERWLRENLAQDCHANGVRIFGIAFTEGADYQLIQALSQTTGGDYYRAFNAGDIQIVFQRINETIAKPRPTATPSGTTSSESGWGRWLALALIGLLVLGIVAVLFLVRRKPAAMPNTSTAKEDSNIPKAVLVRLGEKGPAAYQFTKRVTRVGRLEPNQAGSGLEIEIDEATVSALHATIEYRDGSFYLTDQRSSNGTHLNGQKITGERLLKGGDEIVFDRCQFRFDLPETVARGGTLLSTPPVGGTVLRTPEPLASATPSEADDLEQETAIKQKMCPNHPSFETTEMCVVCKKGYCSVCVTEQGGRMICQQCC